MPVYPTLTIPPGLYPGDSYNCFNAETVAAATAGERVALGKPYSTGLVFIGVEILLPTAPGTLELDIQEADTDVDAAYQTIGSITTVDTGGYNRGDFQVTGRFVRPYLKTLQNAGPITVKVTQR